MNLEKNRILIVEDDAAIASMMKLELDHEGYQTQIASDGKNALSIFENSAWDLVLLDVMLPEMNGLEVMRRIRKNSHTPVILVTARGETYDKVAGLDAGADDYIAKPFEMDEFLARIRSLLRRKNEWQNTEKISDKNNVSVNKNTNNNDETEKNKNSKKSASQKISQNANDTSNKQSVNQTADCLSYKDIFVNKKSCAVTVAQKPVSLTKTEYDLLCFFIEHQDEALSRNTIIDAVWGQDHFIEQGAVDVYVRYLRAKIDKKGKQSFITTLRGIGYIMKGDA